jgi:hypothetical protein
MDLTDDEKRDAAMGCRALAVIAERDAEAAGNPGVRDSFFETARQHRALAAKFEAARTTGSTEPRNPHIPPSGSSRRR